MACPEGCGDKASPVFLGGMELPDPTHDGKAVMNGAPEFGGESRAKNWVPHSSRLDRDEWGRSLFAASEGPMGFDFYWTDFARGPVVVAAPRVVLWFVGQASFDWVAVDVAKLFDELGLGEDVEVVVAVLPKLDAGAFEEF
jgi:hypothetical protein